MRIGFIGLGNAGAKLAGSLARNGVDLLVHDLSREAAAPLEAAGAVWAASPAEATEGRDIVITCLPSPAASRAVLEGEGGVLSAIGAGQIWAEMSTTEPGEARRLGALVAARGAEAADCPVTGGVHRAATGNIAVLAGCERPTFERLLPALAIIGRRVLHTGPLGSASVLKVATNMLATANLVAVMEALTVMKAAGIDLATTYEAFRISSGTSFAHETESQVILSGSRCVDFTLDLVLKDIGIFQAIADEGGVPLELNPLVIGIMRDAQARYGERAQSDEAIRRLEEATGLEVLAEGFPQELVDDEPEARGYEVHPPGPGRPPSAA